MGDLPSILVVDDDEVDALLMKQVLQTDARVIAVSSAAAALDVAAQQPLDLAFTDLMMPDMDGITLCERMVSSRPGLPIVVVTGHGTMRYAVEAMRKGAHDFVEKPLQPEQLRTVARKALATSDVRATVRDHEKNLVTAGPRTHVVGSSAAMSRVLDVVARVAQTDAAVCVRGETGSGKEVIARELHARSGRTGPFVAINAAAVPSSLLESELFGHARGAFTDARVARQGLFVQADGGTLFLDEIGDVPLAIQPKLLRALQERKVRPVGSNEEIPFDARIITATHKDLEAEVTARRFRDDLYYRINVIQVDVPPLRERGSDILEVGRHVLRRISDRSGLPVRLLSAEVAEKLLVYSWPGNVRELENCLEAAVALTRRPEIALGDLPERVRAAGDNLVVSADAPLDIVPLGEVERRHVLRVLALVGGNKALAARKLGVTRRTLYRKLASYKHLSTVRR